MVAMHCDALRCETWQTLIVRGFRYLSHDVVCCKEYLPSKMWCIVTARTASDKRMSMVQPSVGRLAFVAVVLSSLSV